MDIIHTLTAIGTLGMCFCSFWSVLYTKKQATYTNKIIDTKNVLYSTIFFQRNHIISRLQNEIQILKTFICLFLLHKDKNQENGYNCYLSFNNSIKTSADIPDKIWKLHINFENVEVLLSYRNDLCDVIKIYFKELGICDEHEVKNIIKNILYFGFPKGYHNKLKPNKDELEDFCSFVDEINNNFEYELLKTFYNGVFKKFYIVPNNDEIKKCNKNNIYANIDAFANNVKIMIERTIESLIIDYNPKEEILSKYHKMLKLQCYNINDGIVAKISDDFDYKHWHYLPSMWFLRKKWYEYKKKSCFKKLNNLQKQSCKARSVSYYKTSDCILLGEIRYVEIIVDSSDNENKQRK